MPKRGFLLWAVALIIGILFAPPAQARCLQDSYCDGSGGFTAYAGGIVANAKAHVGASARDLGLRRDLWCAAYIAYIAPQLVGRVKNVNMAKDYLALPRTTKRIGALAIMSRGKRGGHIGVVVSIDAKGNPVLASGNHSGRVGIGTYPAGRIIAYVSPS